MYGSKIMVKLLGEPQVLLDNHPINLIGRKTRALIFYLAAHRYPISRAELARLLWPDLDSAAASHSLSVIQYNMRKKYPKLLDINNNMLSLSPDVEVDVRIFEDNLQMPGNDPEPIFETLMFYSGSFLEGFTLPNSPEFNNWQSIQAEKYARLAIRGLIVLADIYEKNGSYHLALEALNRALTIDPTQEDIHRSCMRLHYLSGNRPGAIRQFQKLHDLLVDELGVPPMPQTIALYEAIITDRMAEFAAPPANQDDMAEQPEKIVIKHHSHTPKTLPFTGRAAELRNLHQLVQKHDGLILIEGAPGIGKTRLVDEYMLKSNARIIYGAARELEQIFPYQPIAEALRDLCSRADWPEIKSLLQKDLPPIWYAKIENLFSEMIADDFSAYDNSQNNFKQQQLWNTLNHLFSALSQQQTLILILDDFHWASSSMLSLLHYLLRVTRNEPIIFIGITRPPIPGSTLSNFIQILKNEGQLSRLILDELKQEDINMLAQSLSATNSTKLSQWLGQKSEGNPYYLGELVRYLRDNNILSSNGQLDYEALDNENILPDTIQNFINIRLERVSQTSWGILEIAAVMGRKFDYPIILKVSSLPEDVVLDSLDELRAMGLLFVNVDGHYEFDHALTREVVYNKININRRYYLHRRFAETLEITDSKGMAGIIAWHYQQCQLPERAAPFAIVASNRAASQGSWVEAINFAKQAVTYTKDIDSLFLMFDMALLLTGNVEFANATEAFRNTADYAQYLGKQAVAEVCLACSQLTEDPYYYELFWGMEPVLLGEPLPGTEEHLKKAEMLLEEEEYTPLRKTDLLCHIKLPLGLIEMRRGNLREAARVLQEALDYGLAFKEADFALWRTILTIQINLCGVLTMLHHSKVEELARACLAEARNLDFLYSQEIFMVSLGKNALIKKDYATAASYFNRALSIEEKTGTPCVLSDITECYGDMALANGQKDEAIARFLTALSTADSLHMYHQAVRLRLKIAPLLPPREARCRLAEARGLIADSGYLPLLEQVDAIEKHLEQTRSTEPQLSTKGD